MIPPVFFQTLDQSAVAVTVNQRLSRTLTRQFDQWQAQSGKKAWPAAHILPWDAWLKELYRYANASGNTPWQLLSALQSLAIWERTVSDTDVGLELLDIHGAAELAQAAWAIEQAWHTDSGGRYSTDHVCYGKWSRRYREHCLTQQWLDKESLSSWLIERIDDITAVLPTQLFVLGFDTVSVAQRKFVDALESSGVHVVVDDLAGENRDNARLLPCADERDEIQCAVTWARQQLEESTDRRIAIVVPELQRLRETLLDQLHWALEPASALSSETVLSSHYNVSLGLPLSSYPMVADALRWLRLMARPQPIDACVGLVLSAYVNGADMERPARASLDLKLRESQQSTVSLPALASLLRRMGDDGAVQLSEQLNETVRLVDGLPKRQAYADWSRLISALLQSLGWPGERTLNSEEYQLHGAWQKTLQSLVEYDLVASTCTFAEAVAALSTLMRNNVFQLESAADARLQIVGLLEVVGMQFDAMWVMGMDDHSWPQRARLNPFLSVGSQRAADVPHCSAQWEYGFAKRTLNRLHSGATDLTFSYSTMVDDAERGPSPMLRHLPSATPPESVHEVDASTVSELEELQDCTAPGLPTGTAVRGGVRVLSDQADCPFRAFALHRLQVDETRDSQTGVSAMQQGSLLHASMEILWGELKDQVTLLATENAALNSKIDAAIDKAFAAQNLSVDASYLAIERDHLRTLMQSWLDVEKTRAGFSVESLEQQRQVHIGGLSFSLRIDRADRLASGERLLIDYKTANPQYSAPIKSLLEPRSSEVQLPLYALAEKGDVSAVALAFVRPLQSQFKGLSDDGFSDNKFTGITAFNKNKTHTFEHWDDVHRFWTEELSALAQEFASGVASVTPKNSAVTCQYCALDPLCRVGSSVEAGAGDD